jgi:hypothetical protein
MVLTINNIINDVKQLFDDHLNKYNDKLLEEKYQHTLTKRCLAEGKAALNAQTNEKLNIQIKVKDQEE